MSGAGRRPAGPHLTAAEAGHLGREFIEEAWRAGRFTFDDWHGRRVVFRMESREGGNQGFWYASTYLGKGTPRAYTLNVYAGSTVPGPRSTRPACLTAEGLRGVSDDIDRKATDEGYPRPDGSGG
ncbi:hypothetical protein [Rubrivirga sp. IMCC45206]|uniref:hypothetical protein n=1 Tax=Rubrivirga sp. IMCC45206 TaxID=3391614 RepID=UPI00398FA984